MKATCWIPSPLRFFALSCLCSLTLVGCPDVDEPSSPEPSRTPVDLSAPRLVMEPLTLDFGTVLLTRTKSLGLNIENAGDATLAIYKVSLTDDDSNPFGWNEQPLPIHLGPGEKAILSITFQPKIAQSYFGTLTLESNDEDLAVADVPLRGVGSLGTDNDGDGVAEELGDCDDSDPTVYPGAEEICDGKDNDCDKDIDEDSDEDDDGFTDCETPPDCNDHDDTIYPGALEICDGQDNDCDSESDEGFDADEDGSSDCVDDDGDGFTEDGGDCNDADEDIYPGAEELCDGLDNNCNGSLDEGFDTDGQGGSDCVDDDEDGFTESDGDCDDEDSAIFPGAEEACNGLDDDCNEIIDDITDYDHDQDSYSLCDGDCNDLDPTIHPDAEEACNGLDDDCDGSLDEGLMLQSWHEDADQDTYGDSGSSAQACAQPPGYVHDGTDCNDSAASIHPLASETCNELDDDCDMQVDEDVTTDFYLDGDGDSFGTPEFISQACHQPDGYSSDATDCQDADAQIYPGAIERCNDEDDDCDSLVDEDLPVSTYHPDQDGDGYGSPDSYVSACGRPDGWVTDGQDCNDANGSIHPGAAEACNGVDDDCDGSTDEGVMSSFWPDADHDSFGSSSGASVLACEPPTNMVGNALDCNDAAASIYPGALEQCNDTDDDCDSQIDEGVVNSTWYRDEDQDTYGTNANTQSDCKQPSGYVSRGGDCNDQNAAISPGASEVCNGLDDDCDAQIDDGLAFSSWYRDQDQDTYGTNADTKNDCKQPSGYVSRGGDCNDQNAAISPGAPEVCNGLDDDCDGQTDEGLTVTVYPDQDRDGYGSSSASGVTRCSVEEGYVTSHSDCNDSNSAVHPGATETCNLIDDNCDGQVDEGFGDCNDSDEDGDGFTENDGDCDDTNSGVAPILVDGTYTGSPENGASTSPFKTIQKGIDATRPSCPLVLVAPFTYHERIDFHGKAITVRSIGGPDATVIDGDALGTVVSLKTGETASTVLQGFTITDGKATVGGGVDIRSASPKLLGNVISANNTTSGGGGIYINGGSAWIEGNTIEDNIGATSLSSDSGGGVLIASGSPTLLNNRILYNVHISGGGVGVKSGATPHLEGNLFEANEAYDTSGFGTGGALYIFKGQPELIDNTFLSNISTDVAGAIYLNGSDGNSSCSAPESASVYLEGNVFEANEAGYATADGLGGALYATCASPSLVGNTFNDNRAGKLGGALYLRLYSEANLTMNQFTGNSVQNASNLGAGGAIYGSAVVITMDQNGFSDNISGYNGGAVVVTDASSLLFTNNILLRNRASSKGGGLYVNLSYAMVEGNRFESNQAGSGGGLNLVDSNSLVVHNLFYGNAGTTRAGALLLLNQAGSQEPQITNNIFQANASSSGRGGAICMNDETDVDGVKYPTRGQIINNVFAGNSALDYGAGVYIGKNAPAIVMNNIAYANVSSYGFYAHSTASTSLVFTYNDANQNAVNYGGKLASVLDSTNKQLDPAFISYVSDSQYTNDDFHLQSNSLVRNLGNTDASYDDAVYTSEDDRTNDMGAYGGPEGNW